MEAKKSYRNNNDVIPNEGDIIIYDGGHDYLVPTEIRMNPKKHNLTVLAVTENRKSYSVTVQHNGRSFSKTADNFILIKASGDSKSITENRTFMCMMNNRVLSTHETMEEAQARAVEHIGFDFKRQVVIAQVMTVAKVRKPEIAFV